MKNCKPLPLFHGKARSIRETLLRMRKFLRLGWTKGHSAVNAQNESIENELDPTICKVCLDGALCRANPSDGVKRSVQRLLNARVEKISHAQGYIFYNDSYSRRKSDVVNLVTTLIKENGK